MLRKTIQSLYRKEEEITPKKGNSDKYMRPDFSDNYSFPGFFGAVSEWLFPMRKSCAWLNFKYILMIRYIGILCFSSFVFKGLYRKAILRSCV